MSGGGGGSVGGVQRFEVIVKMQKNIEVIVKMQKKRGGVGVRVGVYKDLKL